jgi:hypothetical protein
LKFLSAEWLAERARLANALPPTPGVNVRIQHRVMGGPSEPIEYYDHVEDGRLTGWGLGVDDDCEVTILNDYADELGILRGSVDPMQLLTEGRVVVLGDQGMLLSVATILRSDFVANLAQELSTATDSDDWP